MSVDANLILNAVMILVLLAGLVPFIRASKVRADLKYKDEAISTLSEAMAALKTQVEVLTAENVMLKNQVEHLTIEVTEWRTKYHEQSRYTAQKALEALESTLDLDRKERTDRDSAILATLTSIEKILRTN